jgi:hypothetical protein
MPPTQIKEGARIACRLGWPAGERGAWGAFGGLMDPGSFRYHRPASSLALVDRYQRHSDRAIREHLRTTIEGQLKQSRHASR